MNIKNSLLFLLDGTNKPDEELISGPTCNGDESDERTLVYYDLETTGLGNVFCHPSL